MITNKHKPAFKIPSMEKVKEEIVVELVNHIGDQEKHFNTLETRYRILASSWLLAGLSAMGYALQKDKIILIDKSLIISLIGCIGAVGILLLWLLDMKVYHRLLRSAFLEGIFLEQCYEWLPRIRTGMLVNQKGGDVTGNTNLFYICSSCLLLFITILALASYVGTIKWKVVIVLSGIGFLTFLVIRMIQAHDNPYIIWLSETLRKKETDRCTISETKQ